MDDTAAQALAPALGSPIDEGSVCIVMERANTSKITLRVPTVQLVIVNRIATAIRAKCRLVNILKGDQYLIRRHHVTC